jgi:hypothetical protein
MDECITVWQDGTWKRWSSLDAYYARNDPDWLNGDTTVRKKHFRLPKNATVRRDNRIDKPEQGREACGGGYRCYPTGGPDTRLKRKLSK